MPPPLRLAGTIKPGKDQVMARRKRKLHTVLYQAARTANDVDAILNPKRAPRRLKNKLLGRFMGRMGCWSALWR